MKPIQLEFDPHTVALLHEGVQELETQLAEAGKPKESFQFYQIKKTIEAQAERQGMRVEKE